MPIYENIRDNTITWTKPNLYKQKERSGNVWAFIGATVKNNITNFLLKVTMIAWYFEVG